MANPYDLYRIAKEEFIKAGVESPDFDASVLIEHFFALSYSQLFTYGKEKSTSPDAETDFFEAVKERCDKRPLQYIIGSWDFMEHKLSLGEGVLIPREDTEVLVRSTADLLIKRKVKSPIGADLCSGTGAAAIGLCSLVPQASIFALELYSDAFSYLEENVEEYSQYNITTMQADVLDSSAVDSLGIEPLDFIISNPPYVEKDELLTLQSEVRREPPSALDGGNDGLDFYRGILKVWANKLKPSGIIGFEIGDTQAARVSALLNKHGFTDINVHKDLNSLDRAITAVKALE